jgi:hypothetical protein
MVVIVPAATATAMTFDIDVDVAVDVDVIDAAAADIVGTGISLAVVDLRTLPGAAATGACGASTTTAPTAGLPTRRLIRPFRRVNHTFLYLYPGDKYIRRAMQLVSPTVLMGFGWLSASLAT